MTINNNPVTPTPKKLPSLEILSREHEKNNDVQLERKFQGRESVLSSQMSLYIKEKRPKIPDGGWGWWVVFSVFILNVVSEGVCFTFGLLYIEFLEEFGASKSVTSWIGSLFMAIPLLAGPLGSALVDKYGCKYMTVLGGKRNKILKNSSNGSNAASKSNSAALDIKKLRKTLVNGEKQDLIDNASVEYSKRDTFRSMVHLPTYLKQNEKVPLEVITQLCENNECYNYILPNNSNLLTCRSISDCLSTNSPVTNYDNLYNIKEEKPIFPKINEKDELEDIDTNNQNETPLLEKTKLDQTKNKCNSHIYLKNLEYKRLSVGHKGAMLNIRGIQISASSCPDIYRNFMTNFAQEKEEKWYDEFLDILKDLTHISLFLELHFLLLAIATINLFIWFIVPYFYLAEHMTRIGYTEAQASTMLSIIGLTNTIGMVILGWAGDRLNVAKTYAACLILCGFSVVAMMYFTTNYVMLMINCGLFGLFFASCFSLAPSLLASLVPLDDFTMALGLSLLCEGIGNLTGPPLAGFLFDITQSWEQSFYQAGCWIIISGILIGIIPYTKNRRLFGSTPLLKAQNNISKKKFGVKK
ncbi:hypothetical protein NQ314_017283 [Rhamnusium bicolor]|uniref:Major facilitator superfamily (MFS) profile domain-containing protein n=1 Tax=Rhamnusium bicolor TaxID=1586634 RepID=A0AAV8WTR9_9CUCU|nr:hypothetical protein NQ314_017283 [Rhamnusium bicolor]